QETRLQALALQLEQLAGPLQLHFPAERPQRPPEEYHREQAEHHEPHDQPGPPHRATSAATPPPGPLPVAERGPGGGVLEESLTSPPFSSCPPAGTNAAPSPAAAAAPCPCPARSCCPTSRPTSARSGCSPCGPC